MKKVILLVYFIFASNIAFSQSRSLSFKYLGIKEGLSQNYVTCFYQDKKGFIWVGSAEDGLNKYDGYSFTKYFTSVNDPNSISSNQIRVIKEDAEGKIWVGTWNGLNMYDRKKDLFVRYRKNGTDPGRGISDNFVNALHVDGSGNIWIGTEHGGLNFYDKNNNTFTHYLKGETIKYLAEDSHQFLWISTSESGLYRYNPETKVFDNFRHEQNNLRSISSNNVTSIFEDSRHNLWIGTRDAGLNKFDRATETFLQESQKDDHGSPLSKKRILSINEDLEGNLWIGTENSGLILFHPGKNTLTNYIYDPCNNSGINSNSIYAIIRDNNGNMWLGTYTGGINLFNWEGSKFSHYKQISGGLNNNVIYSMDADEKGNILIGTDGGGINIFNPKSEKFSYIKNVEGQRTQLGGNHVLSVLKDSYNNIWAGTWADGLTMINKEKNIFHHFKNIPDDTTSLSGNNAWTLFEDKDKNIWIGTYWGGLSLYNRETNSFIQFKKDEKGSNGLKSINVNRIFEDKSGNIWVCTFDGLALFDKKHQTFKHYVSNPKDKNSISSNIVTSIVEDPSGNFWVGTYRGLNYFDRKNETFAVYDKNHGFLNDCVKAILEDNIGNLWISTNGSISKFNTKERTVTNYTSDDGLQITQFTQNAFKTPDGAMYFSGVDGFVKFYPNEINDVSLDAPMVFTDFQIFNESVAIAKNGINSPLPQHISETSELTLSYKESVISFEFATLNYTSESKKLYSYILEGFDKKWNNVGLKRVATYTNLPPGKYCLKVKMMKDDSFDPEKATMINITITPPFWQTIWFRLLVASSVIGGAYIWYKVRVKSIKEQNLILESKVEERTSQLQKANEELVEQKEEILCQREKIEELYEDIKDSIRAAEVIQESILPDINEIKKRLSGFFIYYKPKDIVSGDFYWFTEKDGKIIIAAIDCTGHGVSGALMSINGYHMLNAALNSANTIEAGEILHNLNEALMKELHLGNHKFSEGMDVGLCVIDKDKKAIHFAGANCPLYIYREGEILEIKGNKYPIGGTLGKPMPFTNHEIAVNEEDIFYIFSDGYADQFGGEDGSEKFMYHRFRQMFKNIAKETPQKQLEMIDNTLTDWMGNTEQLDDIMVMGFRVSF